MLNIYIEWIGFNVDCNIASLSFIFGESDLSKLLWQKEEDEILSTQKKLKSNERELQSFNNALGTLWRSLINRSWIILKYLDFVSLKITLSKLYLLIVGFVSHDLINSNNILLSGNGYPFNSNRVAGDFKAVVENEHHPLVEVKNTRDLVLN